MHVMADSSGGFASIGEWTAGHFLYIVRKREYSSF